MKINKSRLLQIIREEVELHEKNTLELDEVELKELEDLNAAATEQPVATNNNGEPAPFSLTSDFMGHGVTSDTYSFWDQTSDELLAKGDGGMRQLYNYSTIDYSNTGRIETPPDNYAPDKVGQVSLEQLQQNRKM